MTTEPILRIRQAQLEWLEAENEVIAIDTLRDVYLSANPSAAILWKALETGTTQPRLVDLLIDKYGIEPAVAEADVAAFVESLRGHGLLDSD